MKLQVFVHYFSFYVRSNFNSGIIILLYNVTRSASTTTYCPILQASEELFS